jgi:hypothetical protein
MHKFDNISDWYIDENGIDVMSTLGNRIVDLRNECSIVDLTTDSAGITLIFAKESNETESPYIKIGQKLRVYFSGQVESAIKGSKLPAIFEGIYDITDTSANICIGDECYFVEGQSLKITAEIDR